jgi:hypothetical protein
LRKSSGCFSSKTVIVLRLLAEALARAQINFISFAPARQSLALLLNRHTDDALPEFLKGTP